MLIEDGWCWYAVPDVAMEQAVEEGKYIGSMVSGRVWQGRKAGTEWEASCPRER